MFARSLSKIFRVTQIIRPRPIIVIGLTLGMIIQRRNQNKLNSEIQQELKPITPSSLYAQLVSPQYYLNTVILFNSKYNQYILPRVQQRKNIKLHQVVDEADEAESLIKQYDCACINGKGETKLFKFHRMSDLIKLQNFLDGVQEFDSVNEMFHLLQDDDNRIVLSFIPDSKEHQILQQKQFQTEKEYNFDTFQQQNKLNYEQLEKSFNELRYENLDTYSSHGVIKKWEVATQLGLSKDDIGQIYILRKTNRYQGNESSFVINGKEYLLQKIEPDPNLEGPSHFFKKDHNQTNLIITKLAEEFYFSKQVNLNEYDAIPKTLPSKQLDIPKLVQRLSLKLLPYVSNIITEQQLINTIIVSRQMGVKNYLICSIENRKESDNMLKKLVLLKRGLTTLQQQDLLILVSENTELFQRYFNLLPDNVNDQIRLIKLDEIDKDLGLTFNKYDSIVLNDDIVGQKDRQTLFLHQKPKSLLDDLEEIKLKCSKVKRYRYNGKPTINKLKYFISKTVPEMNIRNIHKPKLEDSIIFSSHFESEDSQYYDINRVKIVTSKDFKERVLLKDTPTIVYYYKSHCPSCFIMSQSFEKLNQVMVEIKNCINKDTFKDHKPYDEDIVNRYRIQNPQKFQNIDLVKYNILNELDILPSPSAAPLIYLFKGSCFPVQFDLIMQHIAPAETDKLIQFIIKVIDNS